MERIVILSSIPFLFRFLPVFLAVYCLTPAKYRDGVLFAGSILFYAAGEPRFVLLLLGLIVVNYAMGSYMFYEKEQNAQVRRKFLFFAAVILDLYTLVLCKILALSVSSSLLPIGMSFYLFKMISWQADLYTGKTQQKPGFLATAAYFSMFPQITQGPIMRFAVYYASTKENERQKVKLSVQSALQPEWLRKLSSNEQLSIETGEGTIVFETEEKKTGTHMVTLEGFEEGLAYTVIGLGMKILLADRIGILWNELVKIGFESISTPLAWLGAYGYSMQLFYDFWGYSLIAAGVGRMLGFRFIINFDHPYAAGSVAEFYRRWHATLGSWFRDYVYIPLGGSRKGKAATIRNLMIVWLLTGFWHGGTLNFILWGLILGVIIVLEKYPLSGIMKKTKIPGRFHVLVLIPLTWVVFAITDLKSLGVYFGRLFPFFGVGKTLDPADFIRYGKIYLPFFAAGAVLCVPAVYRFIVRNRKHPLMVLALTVIFWWSVYYMVTASSNAFMYFSF